MLQAGVLQNLVQTIIDRQRNIIGPLAIDQAKKVPGIEIASGNSIRIKSTTDSQEILIQLVKKYEDLFGTTSIEVCKEAIKESKTQIEKEDLPAILR